MLITNFFSLTTAFAQDLREDFDSHLWEFLESIISLLERSHEKTEILETGFFTLAKIFWLQRRRLVRELREVFRRFKRLFACKRLYMRRFIAEALAFLLRKSSAIDKIVVFLAETVYEEASSSLVDSIARLYFNALKIAKGQFHSAAPQATTVNIEENAVRKIAVQIVEGSLIHCSNYTSKGHSAPLLSVLLDQFRMVASSSGAAQVTALARFLTAWISQKNGRSFHSPSSLFQCLTDYIKFHGETDSQTLIISSVRALVDCAQSCDFDHMLNFFGDISDVPLFDLWIMPTVGTLMSRVIAARESAELERKVFEFYANICSKRMPLQVTLKVQRHSFFDATNHLEVRSRLIEILKAPEEFGTDIVACCLMAYPWFWRESENPGGWCAVKRIW
ncbi:unnamed protein product [Gongylonema pulchrum]|uniref:FAT domain-containing protein n=1 Tax=Gongylonema pulchrum TaxID=637853 RepID=A0A183DNM6_9BILA|nr:unnamed protein product [Gongylonema pulchrum]